MMEGWVLSPLRERERRYRITKREKNTFTFKTPFPDYDSFCFGGRKVGGEKGC
jgi:hypothetical protein